MYNISNFYETLDLKYPEIAIALDDIDRTNPGYIRFIIPVLTPNLSKNNIYEDKVRQDSKNLQNRDNKPEIDNLEIRNYITIKLPKELCSFVGGVYEIEEAQPSHKYPRGSILHIRDGIFEIDDFGHGTMKNGVPRGFLNLIPVDRFIPAPSKWIVSFIGGDITKPRILAPYEDNE